MARPTGAAPADVVRWLGAHGHLPVCPARDPPDALHAADRAYVRGLWQEFRSLSDSGLRQWLARDRLWIESSAQAASAHPGETGRRISHDALRASFASAPRPDLPRDLPPVTSAPPEAPRPVPGSRSTPASASAPPPARAARRSATGQPRPPTIG